MPPYMTIAGQTAPGQGIMIKNMQLEFRDTHNHIVRHLRVRPSETVPDRTNAGAIQAFASASTSATHDIIIDHCSVGWNTDDTIGGFGSYRMTYQWCIVSEGLYDSVAGEPSKVGAPRAKSATPENGSVSLLHNYFANYTYRAPLFGGGDLQFINNVLYNVGGRASYLYPAYYQRGRMELFNNYFKANGPNTTNNYPKIHTLGCGTDGYVNCTLASQSSMNVFGNVHSVLRPNAGSGSETAMVVEEGSPHIAVSTLSTSPYGYPTIPSMTSAAQAATDVLAKVGATVPERDSIDQRSINDFTAGTGRRDASSVSAYGGYPTYQSGTPYTDTDGDGISDEWEIAHGLNPNNAADGPQYHGNGYTNLENFLNALAGDTVFGEAPNTFVAHYPFEGNATDVQGVHNGTLINSPTFSTGQQSQAVVLNGSSQYVTIPHAANLNPTTAMTIALWFNASTLVPNTNYGDTLVSKGNWNGADNYGLEFYQDQLRCHVGRIWNEGATYAASNFSANRWYHVACRATGTGHTLFVNGQPVASSGVAAQAVTSTINLTLGVQSAFTTVGHWTGSLDEVQIYTRGLSDAEILALYQLGAPSVPNPPTNLRAVSGVQ
jgi:hypothetical protein